jgi:hypothetical protein
MKRALDIDTSRACEQLPQVPHRYLPLGEPPDVTNSLSMIVSREKTPRGCAPLGVPFDYHAKVNQGDASLDKFIRESGLGHAPA